jgi:hypothetical protein
MLDALSGPGRNRKQSLDERRRDDALERIAALRASRDFQEGRLPPLPRIVKRDHRMYTRPVIETVMDLLSLPELPYGSMAYISHATGIPDATLSDWRRHRLDPEQFDWYPNEMGHPGRRILPAETEAAIASHIKDNYIDPGRAAVRETIATLAINAFGSLPPEQVHVDRFCASGSWVDDFLDRCNLCLRIPHPERRTVIDESVVDYFRQKLHEARDRYPPNRILNFDETSWKCYLGPHKVIAERGTKTVKLHTPRGEKECYTGYGCISAAGDKLPFWIVCKGKTDRCHAKFGEHPGVTIHHSPNGWTNEMMMIQYIQFLAELCKFEPFMLVLDVYKAHRTDKLKERAKELNIELLFVPAGGTSLYQPLDRRIFGELKSRARHQFFRLAGQTGVQGATPEQAVTILVTCWDAISTENVCKAWDIFSA